MPSQAIVELIVDASNADRDVERQVNQIARSAERSAPPIELDVQVERHELRSITTEMRQITTGANQLNRSTTELSQSTEQLSQSLGGLEEQAGLTRDSMGRLRDANGRFVRENREATESTESLTRSNRGLDLSLLGIARTAGTVLGSVTRLGGGIFAAGTAVGGTVPLVGSLVASLAEIGPAAAAGVSAMATIQLASLTLKAGLLGVGDALEEAFQFDSDPEKVAEALERLSPAARAFTKELIGMKGELRKLQLGIQERLFKGLDDTLRGVAKGAMPELRRATFSIAESFNDMAKGVGLAVKDLDRSGALGQATDGAATALRTLIDVPRNVVRSLGQIAAAGSPLLDRFATKIDEVVTSISEKLDTAFETGALEDTINAAGDALAQFGRVLGNVGGILKNVFGAATQEGKGLFDTLETVTQALEDATATKGFSDALSALSETAGVIAKEVGPLLGEVFKALGPVFVALAPPVQRLVKVLGDNLQKIIRALGPILEQMAEAVGVLFDALGPLIDLFGDLAVELLPVLTPFLETLKTQIREATPYIQEMAKELGEQLIPVIRALIPALAEQAQLMGELSLIALPLLVEGLRAAGPLIELFFLALTKGIQVIALLQQSLTIVAGSFRDNLLPAILTLIQHVGRFIEKMKELAQDIFGGVVPEAVRAVVALFRTDYSGAMDHAREATSRLINAVVSLFGGLPGRVQSALSSFGSTLTSVASGAFNRMLSAVRTGQNRVRDHIRGLPGQARSALGNLGSTLYGSGQALIRGFVNGIESMVQKVRNAVSKVVSAAGKFFPHSPAEEGPFSGRGWTRYSGEALMQDFAKGIEQETNALRTVLSQSLAVPTVDSAGAVRAGQQVTQMAFQAGDQTIQPLVQVQIGNQVVDRYVDVRVQKSHAERDRQTTQGARF